MLLVKIIPFRTFKEKMEITKKYDGKAHIEIIDNKYVLVLRSEKSV